MICKVVCPNAASTVFPGAAPVLDSSDSASGAVDAMGTQGNELDLRIWQVVMLIPPGKVSTYGDVARMAGLAGAARRVGRALHGLPADTRIPWHRVVNAQGRLSLPPGSKGYYAQRERLETEGVVFSGPGRLALRRYRWDPA
jgi:methylated-DNA-protein-cysteine methyltransferase-like protein